MCSHGCPSSGGAGKEPDPLNPRDVEVPISKRTILAELERVPEQSTISAVSQQTESEPSEEHRRRLWEMVDDAGQSLSEEEKAQLFSLLLEYYTFLPPGMKT